MTTQNKTGPKSPESHFVQFTIEIGVFFCSIEMFAKLHSINMFSHQH